MLEQLQQLRQSALAVLEQEPALKRELVQLIGALDTRLGTPRTFPSRADRRQGRYEARSSSNRLTDRVE